MQDRLGEEHERVVPASERHARGQYFTPFPLIELVLDRCPGVPSVVLDPACGSGRFLMVARTRWPDAALRGFETDPVALELAGRNLSDATLGASSFLEAEPTGDVDLLIGNPPYVRDRGRKRDLYVDFIERAADWLRPGGRLALVLSSAWLDVGYGAEVRGILRARFAVEALVESAAERWFPGAKVNTMVLIARREDDGAARDASEVELVTLTEPLPSRVGAERRVRQRELAVDAPWGLVLRAPDVWLERRSASATLGGLASIRRGFTTNDNRFFYPPSSSGIEDASLRPLLKSPKRIPGVRARASALAEQVFLVGAESVGPGAAAWMAKGGRPRDACVLPLQVPSRLFLPKGYGDRLRATLFDAPVYCDQQLYQVRPRKGVDARALAALLNSSWFRLGLELVGRVNFGDGVLWLGLKDARSIPLPDPRPVSEALAAAFDALPDGSVPPLPALFDDPGWARATGRIDAIVFELLGLSPLEAHVVRATAIALCVRRARKAASARNRGARSRSE